MAEKMYNWDKSHKEDKSNRNTQHQSFSSTLLDEIYRSIDGSDDKFGEMKLGKPKVTKKQSGGGQGRLKSCNVVEEYEEFATFRRASLIEKWMEMKRNEKVVSSRKVPNSMPEFDRKLGVDNDPMFFSSGSSSSDSSFGWCSEVEAVKLEHSCFGPFTRPKQVKTCVSSRSAVKNQNAFCLFDDNQTDKTNNNGLIRSKTRASKIYTSLKKVKQPISPGGRLTTFLNGLFTNGHAKKPKGSSFGDECQVRTERTLKSTNVSTCSSASSFSRSCLSKNPPRSRDKGNNGMQRTVRFQDHVEPRPHIDKNICNKQDFRKLPSKFVCPKLEKLDFKEFLAKFEDKRFDSDEVDDMASDSSSDLFELDHLAIFKNEQYCDDLPVFETTHLSTNLAIASGLIC